jgi:methyl-accepting chemotaxis protein
MSLKNLKIGTRMGIGFFLILLLFVAAVVATYISLSTVESHSKHVKEESLPFTLIADRMVLNAQQVQQWFTDVSATHNTDGYKDAEEASISFAEGIAKFKEMFQEENATEELGMINEIEAKFNAFYETGKNMAHAYITEGMEAGNKIMEKFDADTVAVSNLVEKLQKSQVDEANHMVGGVVKSVDIVNKVLFSITGISMFLGILIAFFITRSITSPINEAVNVSNRLSEGDLTINVEAKSSDEVGMLITAMKSMVEKLKEVMSDVKSSSDNVASGSQQMSSSSEEMSQGATEQASSVEEATSSMEQMSSNVRQNADNAQQTEKIAIKAAEDARTGRWKGCY